MTYLSMISVFYLSNLKIKPLLWTRNWWCQTDFQGFHISGDFLRVKVCIYLVGNYYIGIQIQIQGFFKLKGYQTLMSTDSIIIRITTTCFVFYFRVFGTGRGFWELEAPKVECTREGGGEGVWGCLIHCLQQTNTEIPIWVHFHKILPFYKYLLQIVA